jgi:hypothetical protein
MALIVIAVLIGLVVAFVIWRVWATHAGTRTAYRRLAQRIEPVERRLAAGERPDPEDLERFARDRETRKVLYDALEHHRQLDLFPRQYLTLEAMAEADLVAWLCHPHELGTAPEEIELMATVPPPGEGFPRHQYFVFRYRTRPPHWAASRGWLAGVAGPYPVDGPLQTSGRGTFSHFEPYDSRTASEHVQATHDAIVPR